MLLIILTVFISQFLKAQGEFVVIIEDVDIPVYDAEYFTEPDAFVDSDNSLIVNMSIIKQLPVGTEGHFSLTGASMGEYVIDTGIEVTLDMCEAFDEPILMGPIFQAIGFRSENCPPSLGVYGTEGYKLQMETLPDDFPPNNYKVLLEILYESHELLILNAFAKII